MKPRRIVIDPCSRNCEMHGGWGQSIHQQADPATHIPPVHLYSTEWSLRHSVCCQFERSSSHINIFAESPVFWRREPSGTVGFYNVDLWLKIVTRMGTSYFLPSLLKNSVWFRETQNSQVGFWYLLVIMQMEVTRIANGVFKRRKLIFDKLKM